MPVFNGDVVFLDGSGQVRATNGDLSLRADDTGLGSVIVGSGGWLRPDRDLFMDLGREDMRWFRTHTGHLAAHSGYLGPDPVLGQFPYMTWDNQGFSAIGEAPPPASTQSFSFTQLDVVLASSRLSLGGGSTMSVEGLASFQSDIEVLGLAEMGRILPAFENDFTQIGSEELRYQRMHAASGVFNHLSPPTSGTYIIVDDADVRPVANARRALGSLSQRWARMHAASGIFNALGAPTSGTFIESAASIVPNRHSVYSLGTTTQRWANLFAVSGTIQFLSSTTIAVGTLTADTIGAADITVNDLTVNRSLILDDGDGFNIVQNGPVVWDIQGSSLDFTNGTPTFDGDIIVSSTMFSTSVSTSDVQTTTATVAGTLTSRNIVPQTDRLYAIGTSALRYSRMHAASGIFNQLAAPTSGTFIQSNASLVPERDAVYSLGTSARRWGNGYVVSGEINALVVGDMTSLGTVVFGGFAAFNGGTIFGNATAPSPDATFANGLQGLRWAYLYAVSGMIETIDPLPSGGMLTINGSVFPDRDLLRGLGGNVRRWATVEAGSGIFTTAATIKGAPVVTNKDARTTVHAVITANSGAIISNTNEVDIYNYTVPGNTLSPSGKLQLECIGSLTNMSAAAVNVTPRVYVNGTQIWGDLFSVSAGPRAADFALYADICALGSLTGQRVRGTVELATRTAGSTAGNGDFGALNGGQGNWSAAAASGTTNFANPVLVRVTMQLGTSSTLISYSGFQCLLAHQPFPGV